MVTAYLGLPKANHLDSIKGIGPVTAAVLTAFILDIDRFATAGQKRPEHQHGSAHRLHEFIRSGE